MTGDLVLLLVAGGLLAVLVLVTKKRLDRGRRRDDLRQAVWRADSAASELTGDTRWRLRILGDDVAAVLAARQERLDSLRTDLKDGDPDDPGRPGRLDELTGDYKRAKALLDPAYEIGDHGAKARLQIADLTGRAGESGADEDVTVELVRRLASLEGRRGELLARLAADSEEVPVADAVSLGGAYRRLAHDSYEPWARRFPDRAAEGGKLFEAWVDEARKRAGALGAAGSGSSTSAATPHADRRDDPDSQEWTWS